MSGSSTWRGRVSVAALIAAIALPLAACGNDPSAPSSASTTTAGTGQFGDTPTPTATGETSAPPITTPPTTGGGGGGTNPLDVGYPSKASDYAVAFLRAVSAHKNDRVFALAEDTPAQTATDGYSQLASGWAMYSCSSVQPDGTVGCTVRNSVGDDARITLRNDHLGLPSAITSVVMDVTEYPSDPETYVDELMAAKGNDNKQRVARLSSSTMFGKLTCAFTMGSTSHAVTGIDNTYVKVTFNDGGGVVQYPRYEFKVLKSPGGKAFAVKELLKKTC